MHDCVRLALLSTCVLGFLLAKPPAQASTNGPEPRSPNVAQEVEVRQRSPQARLDELACSALFLLSAQYPKDAQHLVEDVPVARLQAAFRIDDAGLALTSCGALGAGAQLQARLPGIKRPATVQVLAVDTASDLALLRVEYAAAADNASGTPDTSSGVQPAASPRAATEFVRLDPGAALPFDRECWTLTWDGSSAPLAILDASLLEGQRQPDADGQAPQPRLILGERARALDGCPLVDSSGRLLGVWTHVWSESLGSLQWTTPREVIALLERGRAARPMKPDELATALRSQPCKPRAFPRLEWPKSRVEEACAAVTERANKLMDSVRCTVCKGKGKRTIPGQKRWDARHEKMISDPEKVVDCSECDGSRMGPEASVWTAMRNLASRLARIDAAGPTVPLEAALKRTTSAVAEAIELKPDRFYRCLSANARAELDPRGLVPGRAICFLLPRTLWPEDDAKGWEPRVRIVRNSEFGNLILRGILDRTNISDEPSLFVSGTTAGSVLCDGTECVVLEHCMATAIRPR